MEVNEMLTENIRIPKDIMLNAERVEIGGYTFKTRDLRALRHINGQDAEVYFNGRTKNLCQHFTVIGSRLIEPVVRFMITKDGYLLVNIRNQWVMWSIAKTMMYGDLTVKAM
jgi:hypothetical protein